MKHWKTSDVVALLDSLPPEALSMVVADKNMEYVPMVIGVGGIPDAIAALQDYANVITQLNNGAGREFDYHKNLSLAFTGAGLKVAWTGDNKIGMPALKLLLSALQKEGKITSPLFSTNRQFVEKNYEKGHSKEAS